MRGTELQILKYLRWEILHLAGKEDFPPVGFLDCRAPTHREKKKKKKKETKKKKKKTQRQGKIGKQREPNEKKKKKKL